MRVVFRSGDRAELKGLFVREIGDEVAASVGDREAEANPEGKADSPTSDSAPKKSGKKRSASGAVVRRSQSSS